MEEFFKRGLKIIVVFSVVAVGTVFFFVLSVMAASSINEAHPSGVLIDLGDANHTILLIQDGKGIGIPSPSVFYSHGFSFDKVVPANKYDPFFASSVMQYADGTIVNENGTIYIIGGGKKRGFTRPEIFRELGYSFEKSNIIIPEDFYKPTLAQYFAGDPILSDSTHPEGALIQAGNDVYQIKNGRRIGIPSIDVFNSYGFSWNNVVPYKIADLNEYKFEPSIDIMNFRDGTLVLDIVDNRTVYVISDGNKRGITSKEALEAYGYKWGNIMKGNLSSYQIGNTITLFNNANTTIVGSVELAPDNPKSGFANRKYKDAAYEAVKFKFLALISSSYTIKELTISRDEAFDFNEEGSDITLYLYDENKNILGSRLINGSTIKKVTFDNLDIDVTASSSRTLLVAAQLCDMTEIGDKLYLSINHSSDIRIAEGGILSGNFPVIGNPLTVIEIDSD